MLTRRTATVTMSAPDAACACVMTACDGYFPVPTISRDLNVRPAITKGVSVTTRCSSTNEVHDLNGIAVPDDGVGERLPFDDVQIMLDSDAPRVDREPAEQLGHGERLLELERVPVQRYAQ